MDREDDEENVDLSGLNERNCPRCGYPEDECECEDEDDNCDEQLERRREDKESRFEGIGREIEFGGTEERKRHD